MQEGGGERRGEEAEGKQGSGDRYGGHFGALGCRLGAVANG